MPRQLLDLNQIPSNLDVDIKTAESPEERDSRLRREEADAAHERWRTSILFGVGIGVALVVGGLCLWATLDQSFSPDTQKWAAAIVTSMIAGILGFLTGKNTKQSGS
jgi:hypothetical protein